jgi:hypothetical protein
MKITSNTWKQLSLVAVVKGYTNNASSGANNFL